MKTKRYMKIMAAVLLAGAPMFWSACTDAWDDHYGVYNPSGNASIWQNLSADEDLANFVEVLSAIGCDQTMNSPQRHTIWAPKNMTAEQAATIIDMFNADKEAGLKLEDNKAYIQFYQNQTALYDQSVSSLTDSVITMLNGKYMRLLGTGAKSGSLAEVAFDDAIFCSNGIIYKTDAMQPFDANVREKLEMDGRFGVSRKSGDITYPYQNFVEMISQDMGKAAPHFDKGAIETLQQYQWTGNIRELHNIVERLVILCGSTITKDDVVRFGSPLK